MRINQVTFNLLKHQKQNDEPDCLNRVLNQNQKGADEAAKKRAKNGNQCSKCNHNSNHGCIRESENGHCDEKQKAKDTGLQTLPRDKIGKCPLNQPENIQRCVHMALCQACIHQLLKLQSQLFLLQQDIQRKDETNNCVGQSSNNGRCD